MKASLVMCGYPRHHLDTVWNGHVTIESNGIGRMYVDYVLHYVCY